MPSAWARGGEGKHTKPEKRGEPLSPGRTGRASACAGHPLVRETHRGPQCLPHEGAHSAAIARLQFNTLPLNHFPCRRARPTRSTQHVQLRSPAGLPARPGPQVSAPHLGTGMTTGGLQGGPNMPQGGPPHGAGPSRGPINVTAQVTTSEHLQKREAVSVKRVPSAESSLGDPLRLEAAGPVGRAGPVRPATSRQPRGLHQGLTQTTGRAGRSLRGLWGPEATQAGPGRNPPSEQSTPSIVLLSSQF